MKKVLKIGCLGILGLIALLVVLVAITPTSAKTTEPLTQRVQSNSVIENTTSPEQIENVSTSVANYDLVVFVPTATPSPAQLTVPLASKDIPTSAPLPAQEAAPVIGTLTASFLDVGQGDSILLQGADFTILIDAGRHEREDVVPQLEQHGVKSIDLLIGTHPHADHIGQFPQVLARYPVKEVWMSGDTNTTQTFEDALDAIAASGAGYHEPRAGEVYQIGSARLEVLQPSQLTGDINEESIVFRVVFGKVDFLFTGDAEAGSERALIASGRDLHAQILKLGHHGSDTSSTLGFLQAVDPDVAIWSAGEDNQYGHPHAEVIDRLAQMGIKVLGTPIDSPIVICTDGNTYTYSVCPSGPTPGALVATDGVIADPSQVAADQTQPLETLTNASANLRGGPGTEYPIVGSSEAGEHLDIVAQNATADWFKLDGSMWIARFLVNGEGGMTWPVDNTVPAVEVPAPLVEAPAPNVEAPVHVVEVPAPVVEAPTSNMESPTQVVEVPAPVVVEQAPPGNQCDPAYPDVCIPPISVVGDLDCKDVKPLARFRVLPPDPHGLDGNDNDGLGCESN